MEKRRFILFHPLLGQPYRLKYDPVGWDGLNKKWVRDRELHGIFLQYTPKLRFIKDGRAVIHQIYEAYGPEANIEIWIDEKDPVTRKWSRDFTGRLNLMTLAVSKIYAECNIENTGFIQKFKNRQDVKVNVQSLIDLDGKPITPFASEYESITYHSQEIQRILAGSSANNVDSGPLIHSEFGEYYLLFPFVLTHEEIDEYFDYGIQMIKGSPIEDRKYRIKAKEAGSYNFSFTINNSIAIGPIGWGDEELEYEFVYGQAGAYTTVPLGSASKFDANNIHFTANYNATINLAAGDEVYLYGKIPVNAIAEISYTFYGYRNQGAFPVSTMNVTAVTVKPPTSHPTVLYHEAFARVSHAITGIPDCFRSTMYGRVDSEPVAYDADGKGSLRGVISGHLLRGFPIADKPLRLCFKDLLMNARVMDGVGVGIRTINGKEYIEVEDLNYFYQATEIMRLDNVVGWDQERGIEKLVAEEYYYNAGKVAFKKWANEEVNNLDEFITSRDILFPVTQVNRILNLVSPYIASGYTAEFVRRDSYDISQTKDNENDEEIFVMQLRRNGAVFQPAKNEDYVSVTGVLSNDTVYNLDLSLRRCLENNGALIGSFLQKHRNDVIRVTYTEGNVSLVSRKATEAAPVTDVASITISSLKKSPFVAELYRFKAPLTRTQLQAMTSNPYGYISFSETNKNYKRCFILESERESESRLTKFLGLKANF